MFVILFYCCVDKSVNKLMKTKKVFYLLIKIHRYTGLQYLCVTSRKNYVGYTGSGLTWKKHLSEHGNFVDTHLIRKIYFKQSVGVWGRYYSGLWDIVRSKKWANKIPENGYDGFDTAGIIYDKVECVYCENKFPSGAGLTKHKKHCSLNPNYNPPKLTKIKCQHCDREFTIGIPLFNHENSCVKNLNKLSDIFNCRFCEFQTTSIGGLHNHEKYCKFNPKATTWVKREIGSTNCSYCFREFCKIAINKHEQTCEKNPNKIKLTKAPSIKIKCEYCGELIVVHAVERHQLTCKSNPNRTVITREKINCRYCGKERAVGIGIINHEKSCEFNPNSNK